MRMAQIETWLPCDLDKMVQVVPLKGNVFTADNQANLIGAVVTKNGQAVNITGGVTGYVIRQDGETVVMTGSATANKAYIVLPASCYVVPGRIDIVIKNGTTTLVACSGTVTRTTTDTIVDPGHIIPSIEELLAKIADCEAATTAANTAAANANTKAALADEKATLANTKANLADEKATAANTAAGAANTAAGTANAAATKIDDMTVAASGLAAGASPTVQISEVSGHKHVAFGIPKGDTGATPDISIGTVTTLSPGSSATASMTGTAEEPVLNLGIPAGYDASITSQTDYFQNSTSGTVIPTGTWETTQPTTPQGSFLWIKHHIVWNDNNTTDVYSVSRMGIDGLGSVSSLAIGNLSLSPDASGKITIPLDSTPTESSDNLVNSGSVATQIAGLSARIDALDPESPTGIFTDVAFSIAANQWTLANGIYSFTYSNVLLTSTSGIEVFYDSSLRSAIVGDIFVAKNTGNVVFSTTKAPIGTLTGALRIIDSVTGTIPVHHGGTGAVTAKGARQNLNVSIRPIPVNFGTVTSLPQTRYDADITSDMIPSKWVFGNPAACPNGIKCTTADGSVTLSVPTGATFSGETTISIELVNPRAVVDGGSGQATEQSTADYVQIGAQTLSVQEQAQVRENIDAASDTDLDALSGKVSNYVITKVGGSFSATTIASGIATVESQYIPSESGYTRKGVSLANFTSSEFSSSQIPPQIVETDSGTVFVIGSPSKTYSGLKIRCLLVKNDV